LDVRARSNREVFQRIWELYAAGRGPEMLEHIDREIEWLPALVDPAPYHGHDGVRAWASAAGRAWKSVTVVLVSLHEVDGCVIASGRISALDHKGDQVVESDMACVAEFRDGRVLRAASFLSEDDALAWISARPALP
jgi:ketosteroid isomerase-like protein